MNVQTPHWFNVLHSRDVLIHLDLMNVDAMLIMSGMVSNVNVSLPITCLLYHQFDEHENQTYLSYLAVCSRCLNGGQCLKSGCLCRTGYSGERCQWGKH